MIRRTCCPSRWSQNRWPVKRSSQAAYRQKARNPPNGNAHRTKTGPPPIRYTVGQTSAVRFGEPSHNGFGQPHSGPNPGESIIRATYPAEEKKPVHEVLQISPEVQEAVWRNKPVVALESTIYTHGFPYPENVALALDLEKIVRKNGGIPATIGVLNGVVRVGLNSEEITALASSAGKPDTMKVSRRDLPYILGMGISGRKLNGGTTVAATMMIARRANINVFGTGGLGGVHRGGEDTMDVSADLTELGRTPVAVISSGCKSFLDIPRTLEYLETQGVTVCTFADGRTGDIDLPAFYTRESGIKSPLVVQDAKEAAAIIFAQHKLVGLRSGGILFANPIPEEFSLPKEEIDLAINQAVQEAAQQGFHGHLNTPFILSRIKELTKGNSIPANRALIESNVAMATKVAFELCRFKQESLGGDSYTNFAQPASLEQQVEARGPAPRAQLLSAIPDQLTNGQTKVPSSSTSLKQELSEGHELLKVQPESPTADILVFGSLAQDVSCDYSPESQNTNGKATLDLQTHSSPQMYTSNIAKITHSIGGVGHNVALAASRVAGNSTVRLCSKIANDPAGTSVLAALKNEGLDATGVIGVHNSGIIDPAHRYPTAQYVAVNDGKKELVVAMADMSIFTEIQPRRIPLGWSKAIGNDPKWAVVDANWHPTYIKHLLRKLKWPSENRSTKTAYEPVSIPKSARIFHKEEPGSYTIPVPIFPLHFIDLSTPNQYELKAMHAAAAANGYFESDEWWKVIDALGIPSTGARDRFIALTNRKMTDEGIPLQTIALLPFIPTILTKLGAGGVLMTKLLKQDDPRLTDPTAAPFILSRNANESTEIGGVYMRLFPAAEKVEDVVSVNGVGDTFLGVVIAGLAKGMKLKERLINIAQRGAVMTLRSKEAVSPDLGVLSRELEDREES
ncbi:Pseudouridine-metabolizing bifunctional protein [Lachnellula willkommii]|uniref:Pseudouridine-metabolizing bifunctional protein n=1 Tax=Lachnellula willkommii TaxID=215461 RepID=A0A559MEK3_9HELO|nr:Pseudouridine-metabolizing bifunctional protein [Lachnellula willkommii]